jgi:hypothetical protein
MYPRDNNSNSRFSQLEFVAHPTNVNCVTIGPKSQAVLATGGADFKVNVWKVGSAQNIWTLGSNKSAISCLCFDGDERNVVSGAQNGSIKVFDLNAGRLAKALGGHQVNTTVIQYHPHGEFIVSGSSDSSMKIWDVRNKACIQTYNDHGKELTCVRFSPDGRWVASSAKDGNLFIWDLVAGRQLQNLKLQNSQFVSTFEFSPTEFVLAAATNMRTVRMWDLESWELVTASPADGSPPRALAFAPDGAKVYYATKDSLKSWNWQSSSPSNPTSNSNKPNCVAELSWEKISELRISPEYSVIGASCAGNFVSVWTSNLAAAEDASSSEVAASESNKAPAGVVLPSPTAAAVGSRRPARNIDRPPSAAESSKLSKPANNLPPAFSKEKYAGISKDTAADLEKRKQQLNTGFDAATAVREINRRLGADNDDNRDDNSGLNDSLNRLRSKWDHDEAENKDMAASIGESFMKRYKEELQKAQMNGLDIDKFGNFVGADSKPKKAADAADASSDDDDAIDDSVVRSELDNLNIAEEYNKNEGIAVKPDAKQGREINVGALKDLLPPSNYKQPKPISELAAAGAAVSENNLQRRDLASASASSAGNNPGKRISPSGAAREAKSDRRSTPASSSGDANGRTEDRLFECVDLISRLNNSHSLVGMMLTQRLSNLRALRRNWDTANIEEVCAQLKDIGDNAVLDPHQLVIIGDLLGSIDLKVVGLTLDQAITFLNLCDQIIMTDIGSKSEPVLAASVKTLAAVISAFKDLIKSTRSVLSIGAVDISREERLRKCNACYDCVKKMKHRWAYLLQTHRKSAALTDSLRSAEQLMDALLT